MVKGVWHFGFTVSDLERSLVFYRDILGLEVVHAQRQANPYTRKLVGYPDADLKVARLRVPGTDPRPSLHALELVEYLCPRGKPIDPAAPNPGSAYLALVVAGIRAEYRRLSDLGARFRCEPVFVTEGRNRGLHRLPIRPRRPNH